MKASCPSTHFGTTMTHNTQEGPRMKASAAAADSRYSHTLLAAAAVTVGDIEGIEFQMLRVRTQVDFLLSCAGKGIHL